MSKEAISWNFDTANNYANRQNGRLQSTVGSNPKDTGKSEPINQKKKLKTLFSPNLSRNF